MPKFAITASKLASANGSASASAVSNASAGWRRRAWPSISGEKSAPMTRAPRLAAAAAATPVPHARSRTRAPGLTSAAASSGGTNSAVMAAKPSYEAAAPFQPAASNSRMLVMGRSLGATATRGHLTFVMAGLVPAIHVLLQSRHGGRLGLLHDQQTRRHSLRRRDQRASKTRLRAS